MIPTADKMAKHATATRIVSLALGAMAFGLIALAPETRAEDAGWISRAGLAATLVGATAAVTHGCGLTPARKVLRRLLAPSFAWPLLLAGVAIVSLA